MNKKLLCAALLLGGLGVAQAASAQEFDDRWYVAGSVGVNFQDEDRRTEGSEGERRSTGLRAGKAGIARCQAAVLQRLTTVSCDAVGDAGSRRPTELRQRVQLGRTGDLRPLPVRGKGAAAERQQSAVPGGQALRHC